MAKENAAQPEQEIEVPDTGEHPLSGFGEELKYEEEEVEVPDPEGEEKGKGEEKKEEPKAEEEEKKEEPESEEEEPKGEEKKEDEGEEEKPKEEEKKEDEEGTEEGDDFELKIPESEDGEPTEDSWSKVGEELGLEFEGENFDDFKTAYDKKIEAVKKETLESAEVNTEKVLEGLEPENRKVVEFALNGGNAMDLINPTAEIDKFLAMSNEELLRADYKADKVSDELIDQEINELVESNKLDLRAQQLRNRLEEQKQIVIDDVISEQKELSEQLAKEEEQVAIENNKAFMEELTGRQEFHGVKLDQKHKDYIAKLWQEGQVQEMLSDATGVIDYILEKTFGDQIRKRSSEKAFTEGKDDMKRDLHNIPPKEEGTSSRTEGKETEVKDGFGAWSSIESEDAVDVERGRG